MPYGINLCKEACWDTSLAGYNHTGNTRVAHSFFGHDRSASARKSSAFLHFPTQYVPSRRAYTSFCEKESLITCTTEHDDACLKIGTAETAHCNMATSKCACKAEPKNHCLIGGYCVEEGPCTAVAEKIATEIDGIKAKITAAEAENGDRDESSVIATSPQEHAESDRELAVIRERDATSADDKWLKIQLESNSQALADTATTSLEYQPTERTLEREMGPERLGAAVEEATRGTNYIINAAKSLPSGALAQMTTSDTKMFNQVGDALDFAESSVIALRKMLKSIKGNSCLLLGDEECWAASQLKEPWEDADRDMTIPEDSPTRAAIPSLDVAEAIASMLNSLYPRRLPPASLRKATSRYHRSAHTFL